jgi:S-formylglutathione hydrolase FrmB
MSTIVSVGFFSAALNRHVSYAAIVPEVGEPPFAVLYQLHGYTDDQSAWLQRSNLVRHAEKLPLLVVLPSGENSYYIDQPPQRLFERFIVHDLPAHVQRTFRVREGKAAIGGLSMGGYGAIRLGLKYPERYASIFAHSSRLPSRAELPTLEWTHGLDDSALAELDVDALAARIDVRSMARLAFDCGRDDHLLADSRRFHECLEKLSVPHQYREYAGAHTWDYWDAHAPEALAHHAATLGLTS